MMERFLAHHFLRTVGAKAPRAVNAGVHPLSWLRARRTGICRGRSVRPHCIDASPEEREKNGTNEMLNNGETMEADSKQVRRRETGTVRRQCLARRLSESIPKLERRGGGRK